MCGIIKFKVWIPEVFLASGRSSCLSVDKGSRPETLLTSLSFSHTTPPAIECTGSNRQNKFVPLPVEYHQVSTPSATFRHLPPVKTTDLIDL